MPPRIELRLRLSQLCLLTSLSACISARALPRTHLHFTYIGTNHVRQCSYDSRCCSGYCHHCCQHPVRYLRCCQQGHRNDQHLRLGCC
ncbi:MAG: Toxin_29 PhTx neurotoxin family protein [Podoviridae sp. ctda_1]|nr:MAG: Toxin_29 PhTx neurotoxin family protein [Podoviridae sp. ctda_1]